VVEVVADDNKGLPSAAAAAAALLIVAALVVGEKIVTISTCKRTMVDDRLSSLFLLLPVYILTNPSGWTALTLLLLFTLRSDPLLAPPPPS